MSNEEENKLVNAIISLSQGIKGMRKEFTDEIKGLRQDMEKHQAKTNLALGEMRLSYIKLDESFNSMRSDFNKYARRNDDRTDNHETRIVRLEEKTSGSSYIASEPKVKYKTRKKRK